MRDRETGLHPANPINVNINVKFGSTGLGASLTPLIAYTDYSTVRGALIDTVVTHNHPSTYGTPAAASLGPVDPTGGASFVLARADAKALGLISNDVANDGAITFSNARSYTFDPLNRAVAGKFDFIGIAEHEISEVMGRIPGLGTHFGNNQPAAYMLNDLFRYTSAGVRSLNMTDTKAYLSVDGGVTHLTNLNPPGGGDLTDYKGDLKSDPFNAFTDKNQGHILNNTADLANMEALGYYPGNVNTPVPGGLVLLMTGLASIGALGWLKKRTANPAQH